MSPQSLRFSVTQTLARLFEPALDLALPLKCPVCGAAGRGGAELCCPACEPMLVRLPQPICPYCQRFREYESEICPGNHAPIEIVSVWALGVFDHAWRSIVHQLKYRGDRSLAEPIGIAMGGVCATGLPTDAVVVPVPTSDAKQRERGFGHAERIAEQLAACRSVAFEPRALRFTRRVKDQTRLSGSRRMDNLRDAMAARDPGMVARRLVLIVDDILTTGATLREAARALRAAGASEVRATVVAVNTGGLPDGPE